MSGVEQPLLSVTSTTGAASCQTHAVQRTRFLDRQGRFKQSLGHFNVNRKGGHWRRIYWDDPFHTVINTRSSRIILGIFIAYSFIILLFALAYMDISLRYPACHVGLSSITDAYVFSLETIMTIGYGAPMDDIFFGGCTSIATLLTFESFAGIILDSVCIGIFYARFARANQRANTIMFSNSAVIRKIRGHYYFMLQTCERRKHQLVEAHVRLYAVRHEVGDDTDEPNETLFQCHQMRVQQPDDDCGAMLLMVLPQVVVHRIDQWSPLFPPDCLPRDGGDSKTCAMYPNPTQRQVDIDNGNRDGGLPGSTQLYKEPTKMQIMNHLRKSGLEIIALLEGIDSSTSNTMQARISYTDEDIAWDATFERCVVKTSKGLCIDFDRFHLLKPAPLDSMRNQTTE
ncbi:animal inward rectifier k channel (irk-c) family protein [Plasmopara halstedii]|uniref:Animal inward rectifier k channel (Irk-c) family protein n=1 Tax=Plasmopara halstedii TaxID=4781 RepID=A0A0P1B7L9_PLAHL|nr:animal inward rectifier k channel (irk-c) family protein [Plasmopara halstedii]CEG49734.1 animal inward rectifier k channel (irk-c) family protein [Plasmopara halstedii]|eukprot:XP_024586103.1 animal inward rectifier k channel (irk-c) family protein [Plasmopara halstedii]